jgi:DNA repair protein RecO (recombination protein O)
MLIKTRGVVIKEETRGESDKILTVMAKTYGKLRLYAKGARRPKSKFFAGAQMFSYSDYVAFNSRNITSAAQIDLIESFYDIRTDYDKLRYASFFCEAADKFVLEGATADSETFLLLKTFSALKKNLLSDELIYIIFNLKFLQILGYAPGLSSGLSEFVFKSDVVNIYNNPVVDGFDYVKYLERFYQKNFDLKLNFPK